MRPLRSNVIIRRELANEVTESGLFIPEKHREKLQEGTVVEVGPDVLEVSKGDHVMFGKYLGTEVDIDGETLVILEEDDIYLVVESK